ncbi:replication initiator [Leucobacter sp. 1207-22]|uniref:replication initiator n=1 Tax=Leucobacter sp. 1207-22 TaxID=2604456 RepID=UPI00406441C3
MPCQRPISATRTNVRTGEIETFDMRCNTRKGRICPSCAALYRGDVNAIAREGIHSAMDQGDQIVFLTVTLPSFGKTHWVPEASDVLVTAKQRASWVAKKRKKCSCGVTHKQGDSRYKGLPLPGYDYDKQARWNSGVGRLWSRTADELTRILNVREPRWFNAKTGRWNRGKLIRLPAIGIAEFQARGAVHLHVIMRVPHAQAEAMEPYKDDSLGKGTVRLGKIEEVSRAIRATIDGEKMYWGTQCVAKIVNSERSMVRTAGYLSKLVNYACKDLEKDLGQEVAHSPEVAKHHKQLNAAAWRQH